MLLAALLVPTPALVSDDPIRTKLQTIANAKAKQYDCAISIAMQTGGSAISVSSEGAGVDETPRDTTSLESRTKRKAGTPEEFQRAWAGAHEQFLEKVKNHPPPVEVELPDED